MSIGIYIIVNVNNNKIYVGSSIRIQRRWIEHKCDLKKQNHANTHLQRSWNKYGEDIYSFEIIELCRQEQLSEREEYWVKLFDTLNRDKGYNIRGVGKHPSVSEETKRKISIANTGRKLSKETRKKQSEANRKRHASGWRASKESIKRKADKRRGQMHTEATKQRISKICKEKNTNRKAVNMMDMNGNFIRKFKSLADAARFLGIMNKKYSYGSLHQAASEKRKNAYKYKWEFC